MTMTLPQLSTLDWRQQMARVYEAVQGAEDLAAAWPEFVKARSGLRAQHPLGLHGEKHGRADMSFFDYDPRLSLSSGLSPIQDGETVLCPGGVDGDIRIRAFAKTTDLAEVLGGELQLYWIEQYGGGIFLPFKDATNGEETYGGGRYLLDTPKSAWLGLKEDGKVRLDFNYAYFPSCAFDARYVCPLSPPENNLACAIRAGERSK